jgi:hypothetical protein
VPNLLLQIGALREELRAVRWQQRPPQRGINERLMFSGTAVGPSIPLRLW